MGSYRQELLDYNSATKSCVCTLLPFNL